MGLDIQLVVESSQEAEFEHVLGVAFFEPPRQTDIFFAISGIRGKQCLIRARGFPNNASPMAQAHYGRFVVDDLEEVGAMGSACISRRDAIEAVSRGRSYWLSNTQDIASAPEFSGAGWLRPSELLAALEFADLGATRLSTEFSLALQLANSIEASGSHSRIVFWFDE